MAKMIFPKISITFPVNTEELIELMKNGDAIRFMNEFGLDDFEEDDFEYTNYEKAKSNKQKATLKALGNAKAYESILNDWNDLKDEYFWES